MKTKIFHIPFTLVVLLLICRVLSGYEFSANIRVNDVSMHTQGFGYTSGMHSVAVKGDTVYVVWNDNRESGSLVDWDIYFSKSVDGGTLFGNSVRVNDILPPDRGTGSPTICVDNAGVIYVAWHDNRTGPSNDDFRIYMSKSTDGGETFLSDTPVWDASPYANFFPGIAVNSQSRIIVSFYDGTNPFYHVYCAVSLDSGSTFQDPVIVDDVDSGNPNGQCIGIGPGDEIYIAWHDNRNGNYDIFFDRSTDGGITFGTDTRVDDTGTNSVTQFTPSLAVAENGDIYIAWRDHRNDTGNNDIDIYACVSTDSGSTFSDDVKVNDASSGESVQFRPSVATAGNDVVGITWYDYRNSSWPDFPDIYFSFSNDGCISFSDDMKVNDNTVQSDQLLACLAMSSDGCAYVAWTDNRVDPASDIYFSVGIPDTTGIDDNAHGGSAKIIAFLRSHPNPFSKKTDIIFSIGQSAESIDHNAEGIELKIYDASGRLIKEFNLQSKISNLQSVKWSGTDQLNHPVPPGVYFVRLKCGSCDKVDKVILLR